LNAADQLLGNHGDRIALLCGDESVTYADLADRVARAAAALRALGVNPGDRVLLQMRDTPEFAAAWLGAVHAGAVAVALNTKLSDAEVAHIRTDSGARLALMEEGGPDLAAWREALRKAAPAAPFDARPDTPAFWLYSSGTTGKPKGIVHTHASVLASGEALRLLGIGPGARVFSTSKYFFAYGLEHGLLGALAVGATGIALPDWAEPETALATVARHRPEAMFSVPSFYRRLLAQGPEKLSPLRGVRHFVAAGERLPLPVIEQWRKALGAEILALYGNSEAYCACLMMPPGAAGDGRTGRPLARTEAQLRGGVLWLRHPALAAGYSNRPQETRERFQDGWYCTQDLFTRDAEGYYTYQGRADEMMKIAGQWVQPGELEEAVAAIGEAACVAVTDAEGFERLALFVAAQASGALEAAERACESLPRFKRPKWIRGVAELPRTATGKLQRYKLREMLERELAGKS
jgi:benzoate-CoA ligase